MIARRIRPGWRLAAAASPAIWPRSPQGSDRPHLHEHAPSRGGQDLGVRADDPLTFGNAHAMIDAALNGFCVAPQIASGGLVCILSDRSPFFAGYRVHCASRRQNRPKFKVIVDARSHSRGD
jgi:DNA-binding transcriptional LysR family regulator